MATPGSPELLVLCSPAVPCSLDSGTGPGSYTCLSTWSRKRQSFAHLSAPVKHFRRAELKRVTGQQVKQETPRNSHISIFKPLHLLSVNFIFEKLSNKMTLTCIRHGLAL